MNIYKHTAVSLVVSTFLLITFKNIKLFISCFSTGILVDLDHIFDYYFAHELKTITKSLFHLRQLIEFLSDGYTKIQSINKLYKPLHSLELLILAPILYVLDIWNPIASGILIGFIIHLIMDFLPLGHIGTVSMIYKAAKGFPTGSDILRQRLSRIGTDLNKCQECGVYGEMKLHKANSWYIGFTDKGLKKVIVLCEGCHDKIHDRKLGD